MPKGQPEFDGGGPISHWWWVWHERRFTVRRCRELLHLLHQVAEQHPGLSGLPLYRQLLAAHLAGDAASVEAALARAEESFARWPVSRELQFRDVAHYLSVAEYLALHTGRPHLQSDIRRVVDETIPGDL